MTNEEKVRRMEEALKHGKRLTSEEARKLMWDATAKGEDLAMVWKVPNKNYQKWYDENKSWLTTTLEEETTYLVHSGAKAFKNCGGYSIFACSIGIYKRDAMEIDRIERMPCEFAIIVDMTE